jgi:hypothetical protein
MGSFILFCKSFKNDVLRVKNLCASVAQFNIDKIPFYICIPSSDVDIFINCINFKALNLLDRGRFYLITDEEIVRVSPKADLIKYHQTHGYLLQQIIKSEAWRLLHCDSYFCIDSDSYFIKNFYLSNFFHEDGNPLTLMHDNHEFLQLAKQLNKNEVIASFKKNAQLLQTEFNRIGPIWDFGPSPLIWSSNVWRQLAQDHLSAKGESIWDALERLPFEILWYGETLLKYQTFPIHQIKPLFYVYHYDWQKNIHVDLTDYIGIVSQSNWDHHLLPSFAKKSIISRAWKNLKKNLHL